jgi:hypothetical protein
VTYARKSLICLHDTPYYHVVSRCVRRAWLWGFDEYAGKDYSYRKTWVLDRLAELSGVFTIDICAYAVMSNHYHLVLHIDQARGRRLAAEEVVERWTRLLRLKPAARASPPSSCADASPRSRPTPSPSPSSTPPPRPSTA